MSLSLTVHFFLYPSLYLKT
uniref:Uncharacterized protein n=1 Tax=Anguilla anguilla TaxID=7936 RepID=A0A0E9QFG6_ANGAN